MKKIIIFFVLLALPMFVRAEELKFSDLKQECFKKSASFLLIDEKTIKAKIEKEQVLFFVQNDQLLSSRIFEYGQEKYRDYNILSVIGASNDSSESLRLLNDGNLSTSIVFNPYVSTEKEIIIDAKDVLEAGKFSVQLRYVSDLQPLYYVSKDNINFIHVVAVEDYDWRYLKVVFKESDGRTGVNRNLMIRELNIIENAKQTYLLKPITTGQVFVYTDYLCNDNEKIQKAINEVVRKTNKEVFSIDVDTKTYDVVLSDNPFYNKDFDGDGVENIGDNCPFASNINQTDKDGDLVGDVCDFDNTKKNFNDGDNDHDGIGNSLDNCQNIYNPVQEDGNADGVGDLCVDDDVDGILGYKDNCKDIFNPDQVDININGVGDACEFDKDNDNIFDSVDNCVGISNFDQSDIDVDSIGDACDNCKLYNPQQLDKNNNGNGDVCEDDELYTRNNDKDGDSILNNIDNCQKIANFQQEDLDKDGVGDACDNCLNLKNSLQEDDDKNNVGDLCEDVDGDGVEGYLDNCPYHKNSKQEDRDNNGVGDVCVDDDKDNVVAINDNCPFDYNPDQHDIDGDKLGDVCDVKDNRFIESNKTFFIILVSVISLIFIGLIIFMVKRMTLLEAGNGESVSVKDNPKDKIK